MDELEIKRNEKCAPVIKAILTEMSTGLINPENDQKELALKSISMMLNADLNIDTEVAYVPQMILRSLSEMNTLFQACDVLPEDDEQYAVIAHKLLAIIVESDIDITKTDVKEDFEKLKDKFNAVFEEEKLTRLEVSHIKDMIFDSFAALNNMVQNSIASATEKAECKALGIDSMSDLNLKKLDEFLKS